MYIFIMTTHYYNIFGKSSNMSNIQHIAAFGNIVEINQLADDANYESNFIHINDMLNNKNNETLNVFLLNCHLILSRKTDRFFIFKNYDIKEYKYSEVYDNLISTFDSLYPNYEKSSIDLIMKYLQPEEIHTYIFKLIQSGIEKGEIYHDVNFEKLVDFYSNNIVVSESNKPNDKYYVYVNIKNEHYNKYTKFGKYMGKCLLIPIDNKNKCSLYIFDSVNIVWKEYSYGNVPAGIIIKK